MGMAGVVLLLRSDAVAHCVLGWVSSPAVARTRLLDDQGCTRQPHGRANGWRIRGWPRWVRVHFRQTRPAGPVPLIRWIDLWMAISAGQSGGDEGNRTPNPRLQNVTPAAPLRGLRRSQ